MPDVLGYGGRECVPSPPVDAPETSASDPLVTSKLGASLVRKSQRTVDRWIQKNLVASEPGPDGTRSIRLSALALVAHVPLAVLLERYNALAPAAQVGDPRIDEIARLAFEMGEERGRLRSLAETERERGRREGMEQAMREFLSRASITLSS